MSTLKKIETLRTSEKFDEACEQIEKLLKTDSEDNAAKREAGLIYFELMKKAHEANKSDAAIDLYKKYYALQLNEENEDVHLQFKEFQKRIHPEFAKMQEANKLSKQGDNLKAFELYTEILETLKDYTAAFVNVGWCIYRLLSDLATKDDPDVSLVNKCLQTYRRFDIVGPSNLHSQMLRIALYFKDVKGVKLMDFIDWWNFENFRDEDLEPFRTNNGTTIPSLLERAYLTYSRVLIKNMQSEEEIIKKQADEHAKNFLPILDDVLPQLPRNMWLPYARALLMSHMGKSKMAQFELIFLLRDNSQEFWAWAALGEVLMINGEDTNALGAFSKGFLLNSNNELATQVREDLTRLLIKKGMYNEARTEIEMINYLRSRQESTVNEHIKEWMSEAWYKEARGEKSNKMFYIKNASRGDNMLWADLPETIAIVTHVDEERQVFFYQVDKEVSGKGNLKGALAKVKPGNFIAIKLKEALNLDGQKVMKVVGARIETEKYPEEIVKFINERIQIPMGKEFGFLKPSNVYVGPDVVKKFRLIDGDNVDCTILLSYNKGKDEWGWKVIAVKN
jgi:tetratricopeptide (TPR) repeat protein